MTKAVHSTELLIRADAGAEIGVGHVMRTMAIAQAWQEQGGRVTYAMASHSPALKDRLAQEGFTITSITSQPGTHEDATETAAIATELGASWIIADGYLFETSFLTALKAAGPNVLLLDDYGHAEHYPIDLVLNQNRHAEASLYASRDAETGLLLGNRYTLLRKEFWPWRNKPTDISPTPRKVLVTLGGGDSENVTLTVIQALDQVNIEDLEATVVIGATNPHAEILQTSAADSKAAIRLISNASNMPELMEWADLAVSGGGSTCWELAFMGLPSIVLCLFENQRRIAESMGAAGAARYLGWYHQADTAGIAESIETLLASADQLRGMSTAGRELVDGFGADRVIGEMKKRSACQSPQLAATGG